MPISRSAPLPALLWVFLCFMVPARATTLNVPTTAYPTIQAAITASQNGDTVLVADGTYSGDGNHDIDFGGKNITVASQHGAASTIIDCGGSQSSDGSGNHRGFYPHSAETNAVISGLTIKNGYESLVTTVQDSGYGGGICIAYAGAVIQNCVIRNCTVAGNNTDGGGVYDYNGGPQILNCTITGNTGDGVSNGTGRLSNCTITNNVGGGVFNYGAGTLTNCLITGNTTTDSGGGVYNIGTLTNCTISGNTAAATGGGSGGGGVYDAGGTVAGCTIGGNTAASGGGVFIQYPGVLTNCIIAGNTASNGGGVYSNIGTMVNCTVTGNTAINGGGFDNNHYASKVTNCIFYGDTGGEIASLIDTVFLDHCDVQGGYSGGRITGISPIIDADPLFVNAPGNLHLKPDSPCLGAGTSAGAPTADKDGITRPSPPSIGAYEATPSHTHLLWNNSDGRVMLWSVAPDGSFTLNGFGPYTDGAPQNVWHATAVATGADGVSHLLWNNTDGRVMLWTVDDAGNFTLAGYGPYTDGSIGTEPTINKWKATAVSVGPDNVVHLLWNNTDNRVMLWNVQPDFTFTLAGFGPYTDNAPGNLWSATALATGPDGVSHLLWNNTDNRVMLWDVNPDFSFTLAGYGPYTDNAPQNLWSAVGVSVGPDNLTHLLWSNTDRRAMFWNVDSTFGFTLAGYGPYTDDAPQNLWSATALATGPDNLNHFLWNNTDNRAMLWGVDSAFNFSVAGYGPYTDNAPGNLWSVTAVSAGP